MELLSLPFPALTCVLEHMVRMAGFRRTIRLRLVCKLVDEEFRRIIFGSRVVEIDDDVVWMTRQCQVAYLIGRTTRPHIFKPTAVTTLICKTAELLLENVKPEGNVYLQRKWYQEALCDAVVDPGCTRDVRWLVREHPHLSADQLKTSTHMLAAAAAVGDIHKVKDLLSTYTETSITDDFFNCALTNAARIGRDDIVALLFAYILEANKAGHPPGPNTRAAAAPWTQLKSFQTAISTACGLGYERIVKLLSRHTLQYQEGYPANDTYNLRAAAYSGHIELVRWLWATVALPNKDEAVFDLMLASCTSGHIDLVEMSLSLGADVNSHCSDGHSCLCIAAEHGHFAVAKLLLTSRGVDKVVWWHGYRGDPLALAAMHGNEDIVELIFDSGIDYGGEVNLGDALVHAAKHGETRMVQFLIRQGVNLIRRGVGRRALQRAAEHGYDDIISLLAEHGVAVNDDERDGEPMLAAQVYAQHHVVELLLKMGAAPVDPLKSRLAVSFENGELPRKPPVHSARIVYSREVTHLVCPQQGSPNQSDLFFCPAQSSPQQCSPGCEQTDI